MNRKQKKELRRHLSTRQLMGIDQLTDHGLKTARGELVFYLVSPDNLSVLSAEGVRGRVRALTELLRGMEAVELLALDSRESFQSSLSAWGNAPWARSCRSMNTPPPL